MEKWLCWVTDRNTFIHSSRPAEQVEKFPRNEKHDSTTPGKLLDRCWEITASLEEVKFATIAQKNKKAPGPDELPAEVLKNDFCCSFLSTLFTTCLKNCCIPSAWRKGTIVPIPKNEKDDPRVPLNYRGISLLSEGFLEWLEENDIIAEEQNGFRPGRSTLEHILILTCAAQYLANQF